MSPRSALNALRKASLFALGALQQPQRARAAQQAGTSGRLTLLHFICTRAAGLQHMLLSRDKKWKKKGAIDPEVIITNAVPVRVSPSLNRLQKALFGGARR